MNNVASDPSGALPVTVFSLHAYPIKSCAGIALAEALVIETGFEFDRAWMVVDADGAFVTQRELPRMALIQPALKHSELVLRAPGMIALHLALDRVEAATRVTVWGDEVAAFDMGALCAQWFSDFLGSDGVAGVSGGVRFPLRLVRFDPEQKRLSERRWSGAIEAENAFADAFPLLVASTASLLELNRRMQAQGLDPVTLARFRPNLVLDGLDAHGEDALDEIAFATDSGALRIKLVKPCTRCPIPDVDPLDAATGHAVHDALAGYRRDARLDGAITFGMYGVIVEGVERALQVGGRGQASLRFD